MISEEMKNGIRAIPYYIFITTLGIATIAALSSLILNELKYDTRKKIAEQKTYELSQVYEEGWKQRGECLKQINESEMNKCLLKNHLDIEERIKQTLESPIKIKSN